jgi:micrococcal nuclease
LGSLKEAPFRHRRPTLARKSLRRSRPLLAFAVIPETRSCGPCQHPRVPPLRLRLLAPVVTLAIASSALAGCSQDPDEGPVNVYLSQVAGGAEIEVTIDDEPMTVALAGIDAPSPGDCLEEELAAEIDELDGEELTMATEDAQASPRLVTLETASGSDLATQLVAAGLAVPQLKNGALPPAMEDAAATAREAETGFFDPSIPCTFAAEYSAATEALDAAPTTTTPRTIPGADGNISELMAALAAVKTVEETLEAGGRSLRLTAYGASRLTIMAAHLTAEAAGVSKVLRAHRIQRTHLVAEKRQREAEARRRAAEAARVAAAAAARAAEAEADSYDPPSTGGGGGGYDGYTGPRCYAPGGQTWTPC